MAEHYTKNTVEVQAYCNKCRRQTVASGERRPQGIVPRVRREAREDEVLMARNTHGRKFRAYLNNRADYDRVAFRRRMKRGQVDTKKAGRVMLTAVAVIAIFAGALLALLAR
jgi:hypothetical protein